MNFTKIFFIVIVFLITSKIHSQDEHFMRFVIETTDDKGKVLSDVNIKIERSNKIVFTDNSNSKGKYSDYQDSYGFIYTITFSKEGYAKKVISLDSKTNYYEEDINESKELKFTLDMIQKKDGVKYDVVEKKPVGKYFIGKYGQLTFDYDYYNSRKSEIDDFLSNIDNQKKENEKKFKELVSNGEKALKSKDYKTTIDNWKQALNIKDDSELSMRLTDVEMLYDDDKENDALKNKYDNFIKKGDELTQQYKFDNAKKEYENALNTGFDNKTANNKLKELEKKRNDFLNNNKSKEIDELLQQTDFAINSKNYNKAQELLNKAKELDQNNKNIDSKQKDLDKILENIKKIKENYDNIIAQADKEFGKNELENAKVNYAKALAIDKTQDYPKKQIDIINTKLKELEEEKNKKAEFDKLIAQADKEFGKNELENAKVNYAKALAIDKTQDYPKKQIDIINTKLKELEEEKNKKAEFDKLIAQADKEFGKDELENAKVNYAKALAIDKTQDYPKKQIDIINTKLKELEEEKSKKAEFDKLIAQADKEFGKDELENAKVNYAKALAIDKTQDYPKKQIDIINTKLKELEEEKTKKAEFDKLIAQADKEFGENKLENAKVNYAKALAIDKTQDYPKKQIDIINTKLKELEEEKSKKAEFDKLIAQADKEFGENKLENAKVNYTKALAIDKTQDYPKKQIDIINTKLKELEEEKTKKAEFDKLIAQADKEFGENKLENAKVNYAKALAIDKTQDYPKKQIDIINTKLKELEEEKSKKAEFDKLIAQADKEFEENKLENAKVNYAKALAIDKTQDYPKKQIDIINTKLKELEEEKSKKAEFDKLIAQADKEFGKNELENAKVNYAKALAIDKTQDYPKKQIDIINTKLKELEEEKNKKAEFDKLIAQADKEFGKDELENAKVTYTKALAIDKTQDYPKKQIDIINSKLKEKAENDARNKADENRKAEFDKLIAQADKEFGKDELETAKETYTKALAIDKTQDYPKKQIDIINTKLKELEEEKTKKAEFDKLIAQADKEFGKDELENAKVTYTKALAIDKTQDYPKKQIDIINSKLKEKAENDARNKADENRKTEYNKLIAQADKEFGKDELENAKVTYTKALAIDKTQDYPKKQIDIINSKLKEKAENDARNKADDNRKAEYNKLIAQADKEFGKDELENAKVTYTKALAIDKTQDYPKKQIDIINTKLKELEEEKNKKAEFDKLIAQADKEFGKNELENAKATYTKALAIDKTQDYPKKQIDIINTKLKELEEEKTKKAEFDKLIAQADKEFGKDELENAKVTYTKALAIDKTQDYPKKQIDIINTKLKEKAENDARNKADENRKAEYNKLIAQADKEFGKDELENAKVTYTKALAIDKTQDYPKKQIDIINSKLKEKAENDARNKADENRKAEYNKLIAQADKEFGKDELENAKVTYTKALAIDKTQDYPKKQIDIINSKLKEKAENDARNKADENRKTEYNKLIAQADKEFGKDELENAKVTYTKALAIDKTQDYPKKQIDIINSKLKEKAENDARNKADENRKAEYNKLIAQADKEFGKDELENAKVTYTKALAIDKTQDYPKKQIDIINTKLKEKAENDARNKADENRKAEYNKLIVQADKEFGKDELENAKVSYTKALAIDKTQDYPKKQIDIINTKLKEKVENDARNKADENRKAEYNKLIAQADKEFGKDELENAKVTYTKALAIEKTQDYPKKQIDIINTKLKEKVENDARNKADENRKAEFDKLIAQADKEFGKDELENAKVTYTKALAIDKTQDYPKKQIDIINTKLKEKAENDARNKDDENRKAEYNRLIAQADKEFGEIKLDNAKVTYTKALAIDKTQDYPKKQIDIINTKLKEKAENDARNKADENRKAEFDKLIAQADKEFGKDELENAKVTYTKALAIDKTQDYPKKQIDIINSKLKEKAENDVRNKADEEKYNKLISQANKMYESKNYSQSLGMYNSAIKIFDREYPKNRINEINNLLKSINNNKNNGVNSDDYFADYSEKYGEEISDKKINIDANNQWENIDKLEKDSKTLESNRKNNVKNSLQNINSNDEYTNDFEKNNIITKSTNDLELNSYIDFQDNKNIKTKNWKDKKNQTIENEKIDFNKNNNSKNIDNTSDLINSFENNINNNKDDIQSNEDDFNYKKYNSNKNILNNDNIVLAENNLENNNNSKNIDNTSDLINSFENNINNNKDNIQSNEDNFNYKKYNSNKNILNNDNIVLAENNLENNNNSKNIDNTSDLINSFENNINNNKDNIQSNEDDFNYKKYNSNKNILNNDNIVLAENNLENNNNSKNINTSNLNQSVKKLSEKTSENAKLINNKTTNKNLEINNFENKYFAKQKESKTLTSNKQNNIIDESINYSKSTKKIKSEIIIINQSQLLKNQIIMLEVNDSSNIRESKKRILKNNELLNFNSRMMLKDLQNEKYKNNENTAINFNEKELDLINKNKNLKQTARVTELNTKLENLHYNENINGNLFNQKSDSVLIKEIQLNTRLNEIKNHSNNKTLKQEINYNDFENNIQKISDNQDNRNDKKIENTVNLNVELTKKQNLNHQNIQIEKTEDLKIKLKDKQTRTNQLGLSFPEGVTEKKYIRKNNNGNVTEYTIVRIVVKNKVGYEYIHHKNRIGDFYTKNGFPIDKTQYTTETSGEYYTE